MDEKISQLEQAIQGLQERNARVEAGKAWEISTARIFSVVVITYIVATVVFYFLHATNPFTNAFVPTIGYLLSTQSLPVIKKWWIRKYKEKNK